MREEIVQRLIDAIIDVVDNLDMPWQEAATLVKGKAEENDALLELEEFIAWFEYYEKS